MAEICKPPDPESVPPKREHSVRSAVQLSVPVAKRHVVVLAYQTLGLLFGDLATSPLYTFPSLWPRQPNRQDIMGGLSLIVWALFWMVTLKYCVCILRITHQGEGGTFALYSVLESLPQLSKGVKNAARITAIIGASMVIADGAFTPAVSVLSAVEGISGFGISQEVVLPISLVLLFLLFLGQQLGTSKVAFVFSPFSVIWLLTIAVVGVMNISRWGIDILHVFNPLIGLRYLFSHRGFLTVGQVFLALTGLEAMYADVGHFTPNAVRLGWFCVWPAVTLSYLGQGAYLLANLDTPLDRLFWLSCPGYKPGSPGKFYLFLFLTAAAATIIASQAMISGAFSLASHAISLKFLPPVRVEYTSSLSRGQIYVPSVNWLLFLVTVILCLGFRTAASMTNAFGLAVCAVSGITSVLFVILLGARRSWLLMTLFAIFFLPLDTLFLAGNMVKVASGGWVPLLMGILLCVLMTVWVYGSSLANQHARKKMHTKSAVANLLETRRSNRCDSGSSSDEAEDVDHTLEKKVSSMTLQLARCSGVGVFVGPRSEVVPNCFSDFLDHAQTCPITVIFLHVEYTLLPVVPLERRFEVVCHGLGLFTIIAYFGYKETQCDITTCLDTIELKDKSKTVFYFSGERVSCSKKLSCFKSRVLSLYCFMHRTLYDPTANLLVPSEKVIEVSRYLALE